MNPTPELPAVPPPGPAAGQNLRWRKVLWCTLVAAVFAPTVFVGTAIAGLSLVGNYRLIHSEFWGMATSLTLALLVTLVATVGVARRGLRRGEHNHNGTLGAWSLLATCLLSFAMFAMVRYQMVHQTSQDKAVLSNISALSAAADQYYLEYGGSTVAFGHLIGATNYVKALNPVDHESYPAYYTQGMTITVTGVGGLRTITYAP